MNLDTQQRNFLIAGAALLAAFVAGGLAGGAITTVFGGREARHEDLEVRALHGGPLGAFELRAPAGLPHGGIFFEGVDRPFGPALDLSDEQQARVDSLLEDQREKADSLMAVMEPRLRALMDSTNAAIEAALTPEQRERFRRMQEDRRDVIIRRFVKPAPPPAAP
ncbi:MAG TPA: hypothetical protein VJP59_04040 [Gemmatimonadota bacterium]|nr:hypothetical protein [Gemmatimonadota bacterium]